MSQTTSHKIVDAVKDQHGSLHLKIEGGQGTTWISVNMLHEAKSEVFSRLSKIGVNALTNKTREALLTSVEGHDDYRDGVVAIQPGWIGNAYVRGDGMLIRKASHTEEVIVAFEPDDRFAPRGTLQGAYDTFGPLLKGQDLLLSILALSLSPALLRYVPPDVGNPLVELVGPRERGKTTVGVFASSTWAGDPNSNIGAGCSWDLTLNALDTIRPTYADSFLLLDEGNLAGGSGKKQAELIKSAIFKLEGTGEKLRFGNVGKGRQTRLALLSTTNTALRDIATGSTQVREAVGSRIVTLVLGADRLYGIFDRLPEGYSSTDEAARELRQGCVIHSGLFGPAFVAALQKKPDEKLRAYVKKCLVRAEAKLADGSLGSARCRKVLALIMTTGYIAQELGVIPREWGNYVGAVRRVRPMISDPAEEKAAITQVGSYIRAHKVDIVDLPDLSKPLEQNQFEQLPGAIATIKGKRCLLISVHRFSQAFADWREMVRQLKVSQKLHAEPNKAVVKPPKALCRSGRAYCIYIDGVA